MLMHKSDSHTEHKWLKQGLLVLSAGIWLGITPGELPVRAQEQFPAWSSVFDPALAQAFEAQRQEKWAEAAEAYKAHLANYPDNETALYNLSAVYLNLAQYQLALDTINRLLTLAPQSNESYILRAMIFEAAKELPKAEADYSKAIALRPGAEQYNYRAKFWYEQQAYQKAEQDYERSIQLDSSSAEVYLKLAFAYQRDSKNEQAIESCTKGLKGHFAPDQVAKLLHVRALLYETQGKNDLALADFSQALNLVKDSADIYMNRGSLLGRLGRYDEGLKDLDQAIGLTPDCGPCYVSRAQIFYNLRNVAQALNNSAAAVRYQPESYRSHFIRAMALGADEQFREAIAEFDMVLRVRPEDASAYALRSYDWFALKEYAKATSDAQMALRLQPQQAEAYITLAKVAQAEGQLQKALDLVNQGLSYEPQQRKLLICRGEIYLSLNQKIKALADFENACHAGDPWACQRFAETNKSP